MPKDTKVGRCVQHIKDDQGGDGTEPVNAYAVCQVSTGQSYQTGKKLKKKKMGSFKEWIRLNYKRGK